MEPVAPPDLWITLLKSMGMLCVVLAILLLFLFLLKRLSTLRSGRGDRGLIRVLESYPVAPKEQVMLMEVMGEKVLIGVTSQNISLLTRIDRQGTFEIPDPPEKTSFMEVLKGVVAKGEGKV